MYSINVKSPEKQELVNKIKIARALREATHKKSVFFYTPYTLSGPATKKKHFFVCVFHKGNNTFIDGSTT